MGLVVAVVGALKLGQAQALALAVLCFDCIQTFQSQGKLIKALGVCLQKKEKEEKENFEKQVMRLYVDFAN